MQRSQARKVVFLGLMIGLAMGLHIFESLLPMPYLFPGAKLGLANIVSLFVIINYGFREALFVTIVRTVLGSLMAGTFFNITFFLSFSGGVFSTLVMGFLYVFVSEHLSLMGLSVLGAISHNLAQIAVAAYIVGTVGIIVYLPYLLVFAVPTGFFVGIVTGQLQRHAAIQRLRI